MRSYLAVALGGLVGTGLRLACDLAFPRADDAFPVETLIVNLGGAFALGWLVGGLWTRPTTPRWLKAGIGPGVLGSFTTLSAVTAALVVLGREGEWLTAFAYLLASIIGGLAAAAAGLRIGSLIAHRPMPTDVTDAGETL
ncbi:CrcB family protein [Agromyces sp. SYSU K20354]|uniref:fluoride efflux transporter FluC n=1 Tax=Agromyces cavernae TaxID=2898659 RepID=UPI001E4EF9F3|nr:CrcB family protein [Agromyces cavernae]MCD2441267.1 CrcB family protein [Agromyces cavernae]